jgi:hypothetical protein
MSFRQASNTLARALSLGLVGSWRDHWRGAASEGVTGSHRSQTIKGEQGLLSGDDVLDVTSEAESPTADTKDTRLAASAR